MTGAQGEVVPIISDSRRKACYFGIGSNDVLGGVYKAGVAD
jgi:hypothetical protein